MQTRLSIALFVAAILPAFGTPAFGTIVDRTAVTVGNKVITESEILRRIRLTAFQQGQQPDFSDASRRQAAERLIELKLVEREMELGHYERATPELAGSLTDAFAREHFRSSAEALGLALAEAHLTRADLEVELAEQLDLLSFTTLRFRPAIEISDRQIEDYYREHVRPETPLADVRSNIEDLLITERTDRDLDAWLKDQRARTRIVYLEKELQ